MTGDETATIRRAHAAQPAVHKRAEVFEDAAGFPHPGVGLRNAMLVLPAAVLKPSAEHRCQQEPNQRALQLGQAAPGVGYVTPNDEHEGR
jgi:hypothetical protein